MLFELFKKKKKTVEVEPGDLVIGADYRSAPNNGGKPKNRPALITKVSKDANTRPKGHFISTKENNHTKPYTGNVGEAFDAKQPSIYVRKEEEDIKVIKKIGKATPSFIDFIKKIAK